MLRPAESYQNIHTACTYLLARSAVALLLPRPEALLLLLLNFLGHHLLQPRPANLAARAYAAAEKGSGAVKAL